MTVQHCVYYSWSVETFPPRHCGISRTYPGLHPVKCLMIKEVSSTLVAKFPPQTQSIPKSVAPSTKTSNGLREASIWYCIPVAQLSSPRPRLHTPPLPHGQMSTIPLVPSPTAPIGFLLPLAVLHSFNSSQTLSLLVCFLLSSRMPTPRAFSLPGLPLSWLQSSLRS